MMEEQWNEDPTPEAEVFQNAGVLREIFKYLPTSTLISSCSLVNKLWREGARTLIRDYRKCTVNLGMMDTCVAIDQDKNLWEHFCELDSVLGKMDTIQTIPFNSLRILFTHSNSRCDKGAVPVFGHLIPRFPLKYLTVIEDVATEMCSHAMCPARYAILDLVRENSSKLLELDSRSTPISIRRPRYGVFNDWEPPRFESLKKLSIASHSSITSDCAKKIIHGASNLRAIHSNCLDMIPDAIPENFQYGFFKRLVFGVGDVDRIEELANKLDKLEELLMDFESFSELSLKIRCVALFHKLLTLNNSTLRSIGIRSRGEDSNLFSQLKFPLLPSVNVLSISVWSTSECLVHISPLNFRGCLPNLRQVEIGVVNPFSRDYENYDDAFFFADAGMVPEEDIIVAPNAVSESTMELTYDGRVSPSNLATLRRLFPNVTKVSFTRPIHFPPLGLIGTLWPNLKSLSIFSQWLQEENAGAQIFGLHPEEWKLLRYEGENFLKRVQPSRPSILTMRELKHFQLDYKLSSFDREIEAFRQFLEPLLIGRTSRLSFNSKLVPIHATWITPRLWDFFQ